MPWNWAADRATWCCVSQRAYEGWQVHGVDGAPAMLAAAALCHRHHPGLRHRVRLIQGLLPEAALPRHRYDVVFSNSLLHHLDDPQVLWRSVRRWAAPGAPVFIVDLRRPDSADRRARPDRTLRRGRARRVAP
jgi:SAM-dependent methyltransferase